MSPTRTNLERFYAAIDTDQFAAATGFLSDDVDWVWGGVPQSGRAAVQKFFEGGGQALADRRHHITSYVEQPGWAAAELKVTAVHAAPLYLPTGRIPATGKSLNISACHILHVDSQGQFDVSHIYVDFVGLLAQVTPRNPN